MVSLDNELLETSLCLPDQQEEGYVMEDVGMDVNENMNPNEDANVDDNDQNKTLR